MSDQSRREEPRRSAVRRGLAVLAALALVPVLGVLTPDGTDPSPPSGTSPGASSDRTSERTELLVPGAAPTVLRLPVEADATVQASALDTNDGAGARLTADNGPVAHFLVRFDVRATAGRAVRRAVLRLHCEDAADTGGLVRTAPTTWSERTVTWGSAPPGGGGLVALGPVERGTWVEVDVTAAVRGASAVAFRVESTSADGAAYSSAETGASRPELVVTLE